MFKALLHPECTWLAGGKLFGQLFALWAELAAFFQRILFSLKGQATNYGYSYSYIFTADIFSKINEKRVCHFKEN